MERVEVGFWNARIYIPTVGKVRPDSGKRVYGAISPRAKHWNRAGPSARFLLPRRTAARANDPLSLWHPLKLTLSSYDERIEAILTGSDPQISVVVHGGAIIGGATVIGSEP
jgi:hypothetical protein